ncbi:hypothetical protein HKX48_004200 [Thoreauomyces humboldtii]|nr:hypothetical protein HKX48_004200 [Thoreauomyces humboldtii]
MSEFKTTLPTLTEWLAGLLQKYPDGVPPLLELLQNADDAGAGQVTFTIDMRYHPTSELVDPGMKDYCGPALLCGNDKLCTEDDLRSMTTIARSKKRSELGSTGKFGIGFNAVYHWTECPSFITGTTLCIRDPHERTLTVAGGKRWNFTDPNELPLDQHGQLQLFATGDKIDSRNGYNGTLFRFPLRTEKQAAESDIKKFPTEGKKFLDEIFPMFQAEVSRCLLFLKNVKEVLVSQILPEDETSTLLYRTVLDVDKDHIRPGRALADSMEGLFDPQADTSCLLEPAELFLNVNQWTRVSDELDFYRSTWYVKQAIRGVKEASELATKYNLDIRKCKLIPSCGVTVCISPFTQSGGWLFCSLPLPIKTDVPMHMNGYFSVNESRDALIGGIDLAKDSENHGLKHWNLSLLRQNCELYAEAIISIAASGKLEDHPWGLWPKVSTVRYGAGIELDILHSVVKAIRSDSACLPVGNSTWTTISSGLLSDTGFAGHLEVTEAMLKFKVPVLTPPDVIRGALIGVHSMATLTPKLLRSKISLADWGKLSTQREVLQYALSNSTFEDNKHWLAASNHALKALSMDLLLMLWEELENAKIPVEYLKELWLLRTNEGAPLSIHDSELLFEASTNSAVTRLFERVGSTIVDSKLVQQVLVKAGYIHSMTPMTLLQLTYPHIGLPFGLHALKALSMDLLLMLWEELENAKIPVEYLKELWLLRTNEGAPLSIHDSELLFEASTNSAVTRLFERVGSTIVDSKLVQQVLVKAGYIHSMTPMTLLQLVRSESSLLLLENLTDAEKNDVRDFLRQIADLPAHRAALRSLRLWQRAETLSSKPRYIALQDNREIFLYDENTGPIITDEVDFIDCSRGEETFVRELGVKPISMTEWVEKHVIPTVIKGELKPCDVQAVFRHVLPHLKVMSDKNLCRELANIPAIPVSNGELRACAELFDPRDPVLQVIWKGGAEFPVADFAEPEWLRLLELLGLKGSLNRNDVARVIAAIEKSGVPDLERSKALAEHVSDHVSDLIPRGSPFDEFTKRLTEGRWLPIDGDANGLTCTSESRPHAEKDLVDLTSPVIHKDVEFWGKAKEILGWHRPVPLTRLCAQLDQALLDLRQIDNLRRIDAVYEHLAEQLKKYVSGYSADAIKEATKSRSWICKEGIDLPSEYKSGAKGVLFKNLVRASLTAEEIYAILADQKGTTLSDSHAVHRAINILECSYKNLKPSPKQWVVPAKDSVLYSNEKLLYDDRVDCGTAKEVVFVLDVRTAPGNQRYVKGPIETGPTLWVYNDGIFSEKDFEGLANLGFGSKHTDATRIGRFGLGASSVYAITDIPSLVSADTFVIIDPHEKHLPSSPRKPAQPGTKIRELASSDSLRRYPDQFQPFQDVIPEFRLDDANSMGTLWRLPLRKSPESLIAQEIITIGVIEDLMKQLKSQIFGGIVRQANPLRKPVFVPAKN